MGEIIRDAGRRNNSPVLLSRGEAAHALGSVYFILKNGAGLPVADRANLEALREKLQTVLGVRTEVLDRLVKNFRGDA